MIEQIQHEIDDIVAEMSARHAVDAYLDMFFKTQAGGIPFSHPLVKATLDVMQTLGIEPDQGHSPSELSELIARGIPAVTLGISRALAREIAARIAGQGAEIDVPIELTHASYAPRATIRTHNIAFIACGAFSGFKKQVSANRAPEK